MYQYSKRNYQASFSKEHLHLTIMPTEQCNFRCTYCYEDFQLGRMSTQTINDIIDLVKANASDLKHLYLSFFGGEPLLEKHIIYTILARIQAIQNRHPFDIQGDVTTNGSLLTVPCLKKISSAGVQIFHISLDGVDRTHDRTRKYQNGTGSFNKIWSRITDALATDLNFTFLIRMHVTSENAEEIMLLNERIDATFGNDKRLVKNFKGIANLQKLNNHIKPDAQANKLYGALEEVEKKQQIIGKTQPQTGYICYAAKPNAFVIRANGDLAKCTVAFNHQQNQIGRLGSGGKLLINKEKFSWWTQGFNKGGTYLSCPATHLRPDVKSDYTNHITIKEI